MNFLYTLPAGLGQLFINMFADGGESVVKAPSKTEKKWIKAYDEAKKSIKSATGWKLDDYIVKAYDIPAQADFGNGIYAWKAPELNNMWVRGLYNLDGKVFTAIGPQGQTQHQVMNHEMGHHILWKNKHIDGHDERFDNCFEYWKLGREVTGRNIIVQNDKEHMTHYDVILGNPVKLLPNSNDVINTDFI